MKRVRRRERQTIAETRRFCRKSPATASGAANVPLLRRQTLHIQIWCTKNQ